MRLALPGPVLSATVLLTAAFSQPVPMIDSTPDLLIRNVRLVHGDGRVTSRATIAITAGLITRIDVQTSGAVNAPSRPAARREIDAGARTALPGLIDAHVHVEEWALPLFLKYGVTTVRDLHNDPGYILPLTRDEFSKRPRVVSAGALIDGPGSFWKNAVQVATVGETRAAVRRAVESGARVIKVYTKLEPALLSVVVAEAQARGIPVAGHLGMTTALQAADMGVSSLEHLSGIPESISDDSDDLIAAHRDFLAGWTAFELEWLKLPAARLETVARQLAARRVVLVPTLALHEAFSRLADSDLMKDPALSDVPADVLRGAWDPADICSRAHWTPQTLAAFKRVLPVLQRFVGTYVRLGGRVVAGTDSPQQFVVPGASLHRELELLVGSGLPASEAVKSRHLGGGSPARHSGSRGNDRHRKGSGPGAPQRRPARRYPCDSPDLAGHQGRHHRQGRALRAVALLAPARSGPSPGSATDCSVLIPEDPASPIATPRTQAGEQLAPAVTSADRPRRA